jgi:hypothetical protein
MNKAEVRDCLSFKRQTNGNKLFVARRYDFFSVKFIAEKPDICLFAVARPQQMSHKELGIICELVHIVDCR